MKVQMRFQKILALISIVVSALCILLALIFTSGNIHNIMYYYGEGYDYGVIDFASLAQSFSSTMLVIGIVFICCVVTLFFTDTNKRRNYYITNYISIGLVIAASLAAAVYGIITVSTLVSKFNGIDWESFNPIIEMLSDPETGVKAPTVSQNLTMFIISYVILILPLLNMVAWVLNLVWKVKLMKGEKALLAQGQIEEVA